MEGPCLRGTGWSTRVALPQKLGAWAGTVIGSTGWSAWLHHASGRRSDILSVVQPACVARNAVIDGAFGGVERGDAARLHYIATGAKGPARDNEIAESRLANKYKAVLGNQPLEAGARISARINSIGPCRRRA